MARRQLTKREFPLKPAVVMKESFPGNEETQAQHDLPVSTGNTILLDDSSDMTMTDGQVDEGYQTGHGKNKSARTTPTNSQNVPTMSSPESGLEGPEGGLQILGRGVKELVQAVQALRHLGVEDLNLPLPKIVVVGDQSTGKSSLVEGMSEIKVPRSAGTCTRCPLELNLTEDPKPDGQWSCKVFLHKKYIYQGNLGSTKSLGKSTLKSEGATKSRPLGPWADSDAEDLPFANITSKGEVVDALERAQLATLNPGSSYEKYRPGNPLPDRTHQVKFSPNIIRLDISGPGLPNLSFFDLPGVINVSEVPNEAYLVDLVRNLVKEYIKAPDCINLLALTMTHDVANSSAFGLIQEMKAEPRTMGCLTKPDRMATDDALDQWAQILSGEAFQLGFGYHVIKNNQNPGVDHATARREEAAFFSNQKPWTTELRSYEDRFGTLQLQTALSQRLTAQIRTCLPAITEQVRHKAEMIETQLGGLPEPIDSNLAPIVMGELMTFEKNIEKAIDGGTPDFPFQKEWDLIAQNFRQNLAETRPVLVFSATRTLGQSQQSLGGLVGTPTSAARNTPPISIDSDDDDDHDATPSTPSPAFHRSSKRLPPSNSQSTPTKFLKTASGPSPIVLARKGSKRFHLREVRNLRQDAYSGGIHKTNPKAIENMIAISMEHWEDPLDQFLVRTRKLCEETIFEQFQKVYVKHSQTQYYQTIRQICEDFFNTAFSEQRQLVNRILHWEQSKPKTCNDKAMNLAEAEALAILRKKSRDVRAEAYLCDQERKSGKLSTGQARMEKLDKVTDAQLSLENYNQEIEAMGTVKAYYECAYYRFVDTVGASVHCELFEKCRKDIIQEMRRVFRLTEAGVEERLAQLLAANPDQERRRSQLKKDLDKITKAQNRLDDLTGDE